MKDGRPAGERGRMKEERAGATAKEVPRDKEQKYADSPSVQIKGRKERVEEEGPRRDAEERRTAAREE